VALKMDFVFLRIRPKNTTFRRVALSSSGKGLLSWAHNIKLIIMGQSNNPDACVNVCKGNRVNVVGMVTRLRSGRLRVRGSNCRQGQEMYMSCPEGQDELWGSPSLRYRVGDPSRGVKLTIFSI